MSSKLPIIYFLHGFPNTPNIWRNQVSALENRAEIILLRLPGIEKEDLLLAPTFSVSSVVAFIGAAVLQKKKECPDRKIIFVGHDLGACILNEVSSRYPELVDAQILINGGGIRQIGRRLFTWRQFKKSYYVGLFCLPLVPKLIQFFAKTMTEKLVYRYEDLFAANELKTDALNNFKSAYLYRKFIFRFILGKSERFCLTETTFVASKNDPFLMLPTKAEMKRFFAKFEVLTLQAGHWSPFTEFTSINQIISNTINKLEYAA